LNYRHLGARPNHLALAALKDFADLIIPRIICVSGNSTKR